MPFQYRPHQNRYVGSITDLMGRGRDAEAQALITAANAQAQAAQASGQAWGGAIQSIGNTVAAIPGQLQAQKDRGMALEDRDLEREAKQADIGLIAARTESMAAEDQRRITAAAQADERDIELRKVLANPERTTADFVRVLGPQDGITFADGFYKLGDDSVELLSPSERSEHLRGIARSMHILSPALQAEYWPVTRARLLADKRLGLTENDIPEQPNQAFLDGIRNYDAEPTAPVAPGPPWTGTLDGVPTVFERDPEGRMQPIGGGVGPPVERSQTGSLVPVRDAAGNLVYGARVEGAPVMETTGRALTSGDVNRIAELSTSLDDLDVLDRTLFPDAIGGDVETEASTGTAASVGAVMPTFATELFGWGEEAKQRQAVIDRVKQVIGKALEGGVLRKEDESKYARILPTIRDDPRVAKTKLEGLRDALTLRRNRLLESLQDAGYDVSGFDERGVEMVSPTGERLTVRSADVAHYERLGATRVR
jgi:hypothetical protein